MLSSRQGYSSAGFFACFDSCFGIDDTNEPRKIEDTIQQEENNIQTAEDINIHNETPDEEATRKLKEMFEWGLFMGEFLSDKENYQKFLRSVPEISREVIEPSIEKKYGISKVEKRIYWEGLIKRQKWPYKITNKILFEAMDSLIEPSNFWSNVALLGALPLGYNRAAWLASFILACGGGPALAWGLGGVTGGVLALAAAWIEYKMNGKYESNQNSPKGYIDAFFSDHPWFREIFMRTTQLYYAVQLPIELDVAFSVLSGGTLSVVWRSSIILASLEIGFLMTYGTFRGYRNNYEELLGVSGCDLFLMSKFPENAAKYKNSYILIGNNLYYIKSNGTSAVKKIDRNVFLQLLDKISKDKVKGKIQLSIEEVKELLITYNEQQPLLKTDKADEADETDKADEADKADETDEADRWTKASSIHTALGCIPDTVSYGSTIDNIFNLSPQLLTLSWWGWGFGLGIGMCANFSSAILEYNLNKRHQSIDNMENQTATHSKFFSFFRPKLPRYTMLGFNWLDYSNEMTSPFTLIISLLYGKEMSRQTKELLNLGILPIGMCLAKADMDTLSEELEECLEEIEAQNLSNNPINIDDESESDESCCFSFKR